MYTLVSDDDGHWYVIPVAKQSEFTKWLNSDDAQDGVSPEWAEAVGGAPCLVWFPSYVIK